MKKIYAITGILLAIIILSTHLAYSQSLYKISLDEKIQASSVIVEGKVIAQKSFWNEHHTMIYTSNQVEVHKIFKGTTRKSSIEVITLGGFADNRYMEASHQLTLQNGETGVFFCETTKTPVNVTSSAEKPFDVFSSSQGFLKFDPGTKSANAPFAQYKNVERDLYKQIRKRTGKLIEIKTLSPVKPVKTVSAGSGNATMSITAPVISSFSPISVDAGVYLDVANNLLTISGAGFGTPGGSAAVYFDDADDGAGGNFTTVPSTSAWIVSWTDTEIKVRVPTKAGTGIFRVSDNGGTFVNSPTTINVRYSALSFYLSAPYNTVKQLTLADLDGIGGYTILYSTSTANSGVNINTRPAKATFQRALNTWKTSAGFNVTEGGTDMTQIVDVDDGKNMIMFDNSGTGLGTPLPAGVLATCFSGAGFCPEDPVNNQVFKTGFDIVVRNPGFSTGNIAFTTGPCPPLAYSYTEVDLESVLLHELGHAINLGHIIDTHQGGTNGFINPGKIMNYSVGYTFKRTSLDYSAKTGANYLISPHGNVFGTCAGLNEMTPLPIISESKDECPAMFPVTATTSFTTVPFDLIHATSNKFVDPSSLQITTDGTRTSITNTAYYAFRTNSSGGSVLLEITGYSTEPVAQASCTIMFPGISVTGVQLSVYQVNGCPVGSSFPTPVYYNTFQGDGILPSISGLAPDTDYLIVVDGIENTKAIFNITYSASVLALKPDAFSGEVLPDHNLLWWTLENTANLKNMQIERSADGSSFQSLAEVSNLVSLTKGSYKDLQPLPGDNYYRLVSLNSNGLPRYSKVVLLNTKEGLSVVAFADASQNTIDLKIGNACPGRYSVALYNSLGQSVLEKEFSVNSKNHVEKLVPGELPEGIYHLVIYSPERRLIKSVTIRLK